MRSVSRLIEEARESTNIDSQDAVTDKLCVAYLNRIQAYIQNLVFTSNTESRFFKGNASFNIQTGYDTYQLPFNVYNENSINTVQIKYSSGSSYSYAPLKKISEKRRGQECGYYVYNNNLVLSPIPSTSDLIVVSYQKRLPTLGLIVGNVDSVIDPTITISTNLLNANASVFSDFISTVDNEGVIKTYGNRIVSDTLTSITTNSTDGILVGQNVIYGEYSTNIPQLPNECEPLLIEMLERCMLARLSSKDVQIANMFTSEMVGNLLEVFKENSGDSFTPPTPEWSEWI
jgi:hypothetical protein